MTEPVSSLRRMRGGVIEYERDSLDRGLLGEWRCDEGTGLVLPDSSGYKRHGTIEGAAWKSSSVGLGLHFASDSNRVTLGSGYLDGATECTFEFYIIHEDTTSDNDIFCIGNHGIGTPIVLWMDLKTPDNRYQWFATDDDGQTGGGYTSYIPVADTPIHIVLTFVGAGNARMYINGVEDANSPWAMGNCDEIATSGFSYYLGNAGGYNKDFQGYILLARIYRRAITRAEAAVRYQIVRRRMQTFGGEWVMPRGMSPVAAPRRIFITHT